MKIRYKLLSQELVSHHTCHWTLNEWKKVKGIGSLCTSGWLHCYSNPLLAILLNSIHANISIPKLFKVEVKGKHKNDNGLKEGWSEMRIIQELKVPEISLTQKIAFGILCVMKVYKEEKFILWAKNWLNGKDRTKKSANDAALYSFHWDAAVYYATNDAAAASAVYYAANAAANAADYAKKATINAADYAKAADYAADATKAADYAVSAATSKKLDLIALAKKAMKY